MSVLADDCHVTPFGNGTSLIALDGTIVGVGNTSNAGGVVTVLLIGVNVGTVTVLIGSVDVGDMGAGIGSAVDGVGGVNTGIGIDGGGTNNGTGVEVTVGGAGAV